MTVPSHFLNDGEDVILDLHPHWWVFVKPIVAVVVALSIAVAVKVVVSSMPATLVFLAVAAVALGWLLLRYLRWATTSFVLTTDRIVVRSGILAKHNREIPLQRLNDITTTQSLFERMIGAGDLLIESGGERGQEVISELPKPFRVQNEIYKAMEDSGARTASRAAGERTLTIPEQIDKLDELRQRGVISQAEFDLKKTQLLDRI